PPRDPSPREWADTPVPAHPTGPLEDALPAKRPITLRDLLTYRLGTGMVLAESGTVPISDALDALNRLDPERPVDQWIRRLGTLPLVYQPGERWMYEIA